MAKRAPAPASKTRRPVAIDLFAGAGGLALGLEQAGFDIAAAVEYDPVHAAIHAFNFPLTTVLCADVTPLEAESLYNATAAGVVAHGQPSWDGEIDLIAGGPPCQGFSMMGKRLVDDPRNQLVFHFFRLVTELRPRYFVMENVPGMKSAGDGSILEELIDEFDEAGYRMDAYRILNAADFGVPQERKRLFLIGSREDVTPADYPQPTVHPRPKRGGVLPPNGSVPFGPSVLDAIGDLPNLDDFPALLDSDEIVLPAKVLSKGDRVASSYARKIRGLERDPYDRSHPRVWDRRILTSSLRTVHTQVSIDRFAATTPGDTEPISRFYRLHPDGLSNTLRAGTGRERGAYTSPRPIHPLLPRVISVREAARLHSMPDWFRLHSTKWHGFRQIGNAVAPLVGRAVGQKIVEALDLDPATPTESVEFGDKRLLTMTMEQAANHFGVDIADAPAPRKRAADLV